MEMGRISRFEYEAKGLLYLVSADLNRGGAEFEVENDTVSYYGEEGVRDRLRLVQRGPKRRLWGPRRKENIAEIELNTDPVSGIRVTSIDKEAYEYLRRRFDAFAKSREYGPVQVSQVFQPRKK